jgi:hypothetical protein
MTRVRLGSPPALQDTDGTAYLVRSVGSKLDDHIGISRLTPDFLATRHAVRITAMLVRTPFCMRTCHGSVSCHGSILWQHEMLCSFCKDALQNSSDRQTPTVNLSTAPHMVSSAAAALLRSISMQLRAFLCWNSGDGVCSRGPRVRIPCLSCMHVWQSNGHPMALN